MKTKSGIDLRYERVLGTRRILGTEYNITARVWKNGRGWISDVEFNGLTAHHGFPHPKRHRTLREAIERAEALELVPTLPQLEESLGGRSFRVRLARPADHGAAPIWEATIPSLPELPPVRFHLFDDGRPNTILVAAAAELRKALGL